MVRAGTGESAPWSAAADASDDPFFAGFWGHEGCFEKGGRNRSLSPEFGLAIRKNGGSLRSRLCRRPFSLFLGAQMGVKAAS